MVQKNDFFYSSPLLTLRIADFSLSDVWNLSTFTHSNPSLFLNESVSALYVVLNADGRSGRASSDTLVLPDLNVSTHP